MSLVTAAAEHAVKQARERGCCCTPTTRLAGWKEGPSGAPLPVVMVAHDEWCPYLRALDDDEPLPRLRLVEFDPSESA